VGSGPALLIVRVSPAGGAVKVVRPVGPLHLDCAGGGRGYAAIRGWAD
jgi:hypothetical protein